MSKVRNALACAALSSLCLGAANAEEGLSVVAVHNAPQELALKARLEALVNQYKLGKWLYTKAIRIDQDVWPPHSHPVLTLGVRESMPRDDLYLVGGLLHEQFHWNMVLNAKFSPEETTALVKTKFPGLDPRQPKGAGDVDSTYNHVLVCYMEYRALAGIFGDDAAVEAIKRHPFYTGIYALVVDHQNREVLEELLRQEEVSF